jgi:hypothetical protein
MHELDQWVLSSARRRRGGGGGLGGVARCAYQNGLFLIDLELFLRIHIEKLELFIPRNC